MQQNETVVASAPAKVILFGEHCVVLGTTALATAISLRTYVQSEAIEGVCKLVVSLSKAGIPTEYSWTIEELNSFQGERSESNEELVNWVKEKTKDIQPLYLIPACQSFLIAYILFHNDKSGLKCTVKSQIPVGVGLGSSAAYNVALSLSVMRFFRFGPFSGNSDTISEEGYEKVKDYSLLFERFMHGNPSGIDNATATYGGIVIFKKGQKIQAIPGINFKFLITDTTIQRNTKILVQKVGTLHATFPEVVNPILESVESICQRIIGGFSKNNTLAESEKEENALVVRTQMEMLMSVNHHLLGALGVGHRALDDIYHLSSGMNMYSKLTGAGGGGCAITLVKEYPSQEVDSLIEKFKGQGFNCFFVDISEGGARLHASIPELDNFQ